MSSAEGVSLALTMEEEATIENTTSYGIAEIIAHFEHDIDQSNRDLEDAVEFAENLLHRQHHHPREEQHVVSTTEDQLQMADDTSRTDVSALTDPTRFVTVTTLPSSHPTEERVSAQNGQLSMAAVTPSFALNVAKVLGGNCHIAIDGSTAKVPVAYLLEALQQLLSEREEFIEETLELMEISRRTINMAVDMKKTEMLSGIGID